LTIWGSNIGHALAKNSLLLKEKSFFYTISQYFVAKVAIVTESEETPKQTRVSLMEYT
jgi:hypothetical protein